MADPFALRLAQRERALAEGLDLIGWTFDPLDVEAAALGIGRLGAIVEKYLADADRLVAEWWLRMPHVGRRIAAAGTLVMRAQDAADAPVITLGGPGDLAARRVWVEFSAGGLNDTDADAATRAYLREVLTRHFAHGYRIVDFAHRPTTGVARYLLAKSVSR